MLQTCSNNPAFMPRPFEPHIIRLPLREARITLKNRGERRAAKLRSKRVYTPLRAKKTV